MVQIPSPQASKALESSDSKAFFVRFGHYKLFDSIHINLLLFTSILSAKCRRKRNLVLIYPTRRLLLSPARRREYG